MSTKHMATPWKFVDRELMEDGGVYPRHLLTCAGEYHVATLESVLIAEMRWKDKEKFAASDADNKEIAEFIVTACNAHDDLVKALQGVLRVADRKTDEFDAARAALAKAGIK